MSSLEPSLLCLVLRHPHLHTSILILSFIKDNKECFWNAQIHYLENASEHWTQYTKNSSNSTLKRQPNGIWNKGHNHVCKGTQIANNHKRRCSVSLIIRETQLTTELVKKIIGLWNDLYTFKFCVMLIYSTLLKIGCNFSELSASSNFHLTPTHPNSPSHLILSLFLPLGGLWLTGHDLAFD